MNYVDAVPKNDEVVEANGNAMPCILLFVIKRTTFDAVRIECRSYLSAMVRSSHKSQHTDLVVVTGVKIFVDPKAVMYLVGCRMDFVVSL